MTTIHQLLDFRINPEDFRELGRELVNPTTQRRVEKSIAALKSLAQSHGSERDFKAEELKYIYGLFMDTFNRQPASLEQLFRSRLSLNKLSYAIGYRESQQALLLDQPQALAAALQLLEKQGGPECLTGLVDVLLQNWGMPGQEQISRHLAQWLARTPDKMPQIFKDQSPYLLNAYGPLQWANWLIQNQKPLTEAYRLLSLREHTRAYPFFLEVARLWLHRSLTQMSWRQVLPQVASWLHENPGDVSHAKQLLAPLILACDESESPGTPVQRELHQLSDACIGSPEQAGRWQPWAQASAQEIEKLERARCVVESWVKQLFIEIFFNELAGEADPERLQFWSHYLRHIENFYIYGQPESQSRLMRHPQLRMHLSKHWRSLTGRKMQHVFVMEAKNHLLIEFGIKGDAFYAIRKTHPEAPSLLSRSLSVDDFKPFGLRTTNIWPHLEFDINSLPEGRLPHHRGWQRRLGFWMEKYIING